MMYYVMLKADSQGKPEDHWAVHLHTENADDAIFSYADFVKSYGKCNVRLVEVIETIVEVKAAIK